MNENTYFMLTLAVIILAVSSLCHAVVRNFLLASVAGACVGVAVYQGVAFFGVAGLSPLYSEAALQMIVSSFLLAGATGIPFVLYRRKRRE